MKKLTCLKAYDARAEIGLNIDEGITYRIGRAFAQHILCFFDVKALSPFKVVVNSGNSAVGQTFDALSEKLLALGEPLEFIRVQHAPDATLTNWIPNLLLPENHPAAALVKSTSKWLTRVRLLKMYCQLTALMRFQ
jgi:phosphomannomutase